MEGTMNVKIFPQEKQLLFPVAVYSVSILCVISQPGSFIYSMTDTNPITVTYKDSP